MDLLERSLFMFIGGIIGFILGYIVRSLREVKEELDEVDEIVKHERNDSGFVRKPLVLDVTLLVLMVITVWAAFSSQVALNSYKNIVECTVEHNTELGKALANRDLAIRDGTDSEITLWLKYNSLYDQAKTEPKRIPALQEKLNHAISEHRIALKDLQVARESYPYPSPDGLNKCEAD